MNYNNDFKYDLKVGQVKEQELGKIFTNAKIEVKYDLQGLTTGNVFVEYESRNKPSGLSTTEADYYCFVFGDTWHLIKTDLLKQRCRELINTRRDIRGGDMNTSKGILLPINKLF